MNLYIQSFLKQTVVFSLMVVLVGCASGSHNPLPTAPDQNSSDSMTGDSVPGLTDGNTGSNSGQAADSGHLLLAYDMIYIDPDHPDGPKVEIIPLREGEIHLNILKFLEDGPCFNCFKIVGFNFPEPGIFDVDIQIDHPFDILDFSVFDVRGIMMFRGSHVFPVAGKSISDPDLGDGALLNADGYTALYNGNTIDAPVGGLQKYYEGNFATPEIPNSDINGYKYYTTDNPANDRNAFYADSSDVQTFSIKLPTGPFVLGYAVDANWWTPIESPVDDPLTDFDVDANCPEPWKIVVTEEPIGDGLTDQGGSTKLTIDVYDWQGKDTHHDPVVECPELFDGQLTATWFVDGADYSRYEVTLSNAKLASGGEYICLVGVEANENDPTGTPWLDLTAYQTQTLTVIEIPTLDPVAVADADPNQQYEGLPVHFSGSDSYDPDGGEIQLYEWDWDYDSVTGFVPDQEGEEVDHTWHSSGDYLVQLRVTDDESETDILDEPLEITITDHQPPEACGEADPLSTIICEPVHFTDCGSVAYDGAEIILNEWDWDYDSYVGFVPDEEGTDVYHTWDIPGTYYVQYRVTDDEGATDELDVPLSIVIMEELPTAVASKDKSEAEVCEDITFDGSESHDNDCEGAEIVSWVWDWENDGQYDDEGAVIVHAFTEPGIQHVQLKVTDDEGSTDELDVPLELVITQQNPTAEASVDKEEALVCEVITFNGSTSYDNDCNGNTIVSWEWDFDNDGEYDVEGEIVQYFFNDPGLHTVQLRVTDDEGSIDELDQPVEITAENALPTAIAEAYQDAPDDLTIDFNGSASHDNDCNDTEIVLYEWNFNGDGFYWMDGGPYPTHSYSIYSNYYPQLRVTDDEGETDLLDEPLEIVIRGLKVTTPDGGEEWAPGSDQEVTWISANLPGTVFIWYSKDNFFTDIHTIANYELNDGSFIWTDIPNDPSTTVKILITSTDYPGVFDISDEYFTILQSIEILTPNGGEQWKSGTDEDITWTSTNLVGTVFIEYSKDYFSSDINTIAIDEVNDGICKWTDIPCDLSDTLRVRVSSTTYPIVYDISDNDFSIVNELPTASAEASDYNPVVNDPVEFNGSASHDNDCGNETIVQWEWDFDYDPVGGFVPDPETGEIVIHTYTTPGEYLVQLRVFDDEGSTDLLDDPLVITVYPEPSGNLIWAKRAGGANLNGCYGNAITTLSDNSTVVSGDFTGSVTFGQGELNETVLTPASSSYDLFIARYNTDGTLAWAKRAGGTGNEDTFAITALSDNSTVVSGGYSGHAIFGQGEPNETHLPSATGDIFIARYNPDGTLAWAKSAGGTSFDDGLAITTLSDNSTVVSGYFAYHGGSATFGQGEPNETVLTSAGEGDIFIARYDSDGTLTWAKRAGGIYFDRGNAITTLSDDSTVVSGVFEESATFGQGELNETVLTASDFDIFIARYNPDGTLAWAKGVGGIYYDAGNAITTLSDNSTVVSGSFRGTATFGQGEPNETVLTSGFFPDIFIARYNPDGTLAWAKRAGGTSHYQGKAITTLSDNSTVVSGYIYGSATFGQGEPNETVLTSAGEEDIFIARFNTDGTLAWAKRAGGTSYDFGNAITTLSDNSTVVSGDFRGSATFGQGELNETVLTSAGAVDMFIARYSE